MYIEIQEPIAKVELITPKEFIGNVIELAQDHRGMMKNQQFLDQNRAVIHYEIPMAELVGDFYDDLKSVTSGYASMNYEFLRYQADTLEKLDILVAGERVDAFSTIVHRDKARSVGTRITKKLRDEIPKAQFAITIQAALGNTVIAREDISALRKDVTAKLYG